MRSHLLPPVLRLNLANLREVMVALCLTFLLVAPLNARNTALTAIEVYRGPDGFSYVHITDVLINGKAELRVCGAAQQIDKSAYGKLAKISLASGDSIEYGSDGALVLKKDGQTYCVVPSNVKFDKDVVLTLTQLAEHAVLGGKVLSSSTSAGDAPPPLQPNVYIVFVAEPNVELAEYLRAERASTIANWQDFTSRYPSSEHTVAARQALASLLVKDGVESFSAYRKMENGPSQALIDLRNAGFRSQQALALAASNSAASQLRLDVLKELAALTEDGQKEMEAYRQAFIDRKSGYSHLLRASNLADESVGIDSSFEPAKGLQSATMQETSKIEAALHSAESLAASQRFDDAFAAIADYTMFAEEDARLATIVNATYSFHFASGQRYAAAQNWQGAVAELKQAAQIQNTEEVSNALKDVQHRLESARNQAAAMDALERSRSLAEQRDVVQAYELLDSLPEAQRALVVGDIEKLAPLYAQGLLQEAKELQQAHDPIRGLADEVGIQHAYEYFRRAAKLSDNANVRDRMATLADKLSEYYLAQGRRYLNKPLGSGVGLGWHYLGKAIPYKAASLDSIRDEMTKAASIYQIRSRLSIGVMFRDQTSRRDSGGFADQLADAIAAGLEASGLPVKVMRSTEAASLEPNFQLIGDVIQHRRILVPTVEPMESKYRAGQYEIPNEQWNRANRAYETALPDLQNAQKALDAAQARKKKNEIAEAEQRLSEVRKGVEEKHSALDSLTRTVPTDIVRPYTYTRKSLDLDAVVQLQFRISDSSGAQAVSTIPLIREIHQTFTLLENVKPEDTEGVKAQGTIPDEIQFLTDVEIDARDRLIKAVCQRTAELPGKVLDRAHRQAAEGDLEGAAESYILYLNSTPASIKGAQREEAESFLLEKFNMQVVGLPAISTH